MLEYAAVVLTYNRPNLLEENILAVLDQKLLPKELIVVDNNSTDHTESLVKKYQENDRVPIRYVKLKRNYGSAGGFYYAIKTAYDLGYEYILTMDDDGKPYNSDTFRMLNIALEEAVKKNDCLILGPLVTYDGTHITFGPEYSEDFIKEIKKEEKPIFRDYISPYNGTIISRKCIDRIGLPKKEFYLYGDEIDYMFRAQEAHVLTQTVLNAVYQHPKAKEKVHMFLGKHIVSYEDASARKQYYYVRNHYYALKSHGFRGLAGRLIINRIISISFFEHEKAEKFRNLIWAVRDARKDKICEKMGL